MSPLNLAVLVGTLAKPAEPRLLPDGSTVWELDVAIRTDGRAPATVPVSWAEPAGSGGKAEPGGRTPPAASGGKVPSRPADPAAWAAGDELVVVGAVRRRFYRAGGATVSRTDVLAEAVVPARQRKRVAAVLAEAVAPLGSP
jgi:single-strand DNA-binding protein